jgi:hypothetical protein
MLKAAFRAGWVIQAVDLSGQGCADLIKAAGVLRQLRTSKPEPCMQTHFPSTKSLQNPSGP